MKTNYLLFITVLVLSFSTLKAQFVTIPDANFNTYLQANYGSCFTAGQLDTTCSAVLNATTMSPRNLSITDITGVKYFKSLQTLNCSNNQLSTLPLLPHSLQYLYCDTNLFATINYLPVNVVGLYCSHNQLTSISGSTALEYLICDHNQLTSIASYPNLEDLNCSYNQLTSLPVFSGSPSYSRLQYLDCGYNQLTVLPDMPASIFRLKCSNNQLTTLPTIYLNYGLTMDTLDCRNNLLNCLPFLPSNMITLLASGNNIFCLANIPKPNPLYFTFTSDIGMNVCTTSDNPNHCSLTLNTTNVITNEVVWQLYPNPSKGIVNITNLSQGVSVAKIKVLSMVGTEVYSMDATSLDNITLDLSNVQKGIYYVQFIMDQQVISKKLILE